MADSDSDSGVQTENAGSLKSRVFRAGSWILFGHFLALFIRLAGSLILSRIYAPEAFGILSIVTTFVVVLSLLTDIGLRPAIIQSPNGGDSTFLNTAWTIQVLRGVLIWALCALVAFGLHLAIVANLVPPSSVYAYPDLPALLVVAAFAATIMGFQSMKSITASRDLNLKRITIIELSSQFASLIFVAVLGWATQSIWAYVAGGLSYWILSVLLGHLLLRGPPDRFSWNRQAAKELSHFGKWIFVSSALGTLASNGDKLLLGAWAAPSTLGHYSIASSLASAPEIIANRLFGSVSLPALSEIARSRSERLPELYARIRLITDLALVLTAGILFGSGRAMIDLLYDARYSPAGPMLEWLSFGLIFFARFGLAQSLYLALGRPNYVTAINVTKLCSLFFLVPTLFYAFDITGAIIGVAFHLAPAMFLIFYLNHRLGLTSIRHEFFAIAVWPVGWLLGVMVAQLASTIKLSLGAWV